MKTIPSDVTIEVKDFTSEFFEKHIRKRRTRKELSLALKKKLTKVNKVQKYSPENDM